MEAVVDSPVLTVKGAAAFLRVTPVYIRRLIKTGRLPASRIGDEYRIRLATLERLLDENIVTVPMELRVTAGRGNARGRPPKRTPGKK